MEKGLTSFGPQLSSYGWIMAAKGRRGSFLWEYVPGNVDHVPGGGLTPMRLWAILFGLTELQKTKKGQKIGRGFLRILGAGE